LKIFGVLIAEKPAPPGFRRRTDGTHMRMAKGYRTHLLEVKVIPLKPDKWEWQVCDRDTPIVMGYETTRETAQVKGDSALFLLLSL